MNHLKYFKILLQYWFNLLICRIPIAVVKTEGTPNSWIISSTATRMLRMSTYGIMFSTSIDGNVQDVFLPMNDVFYVTGVWKL